MNITKLQKMAACVMMVAGVTTVWAMPAKRGQWHKLQLTDGTYVEAQLMGDENLHYYQTADGSLYTTTETEGVYRKTSQTMLNVNRQMKVRRSSGPRREFGVPTHYTGSKKGIIILVNYKDVAFKSANNQARFDAIANTEGYSASPFKGSVHDYFSAQSYGQFDLTFDVVGPVTLSKNRSYYGGNDSQGNDKHPEEMIIEACNAVNDQVTWSDYDWDGDGGVDQVFVLYAGQGEADGGAASTIWPHEWELSAATGSTLVLQNTVIDTYACGPELNGSNAIDGIGTICHEFSHCLGIPDFYDTSGETDNYGMGSWSLMDYGCYNGNGYLPCDFTGYERWFCGWVDPIVVVPGQGLHVSAMQPITQTGDVYIIYNQANSNEYYILQNIQQEGWNADAPAEGMLVMHVDYNKSVWQEDAVNNTSSRQRCTIVPADNSCSLFTESHDTYPYGSKNALGNTTTPAAKLYNNNSDGKKLLNVEITDITQNADGTVSFDVDGGQGDNPDTPVDPVDGVVFYESFDQCNGTGGNDNKWSGSIASSAFNPDNAGWEFSFARGANKCARFGSGSAMGIATTPAFNMPASGKATLTFLAAPWGNESPTMNISVESGSASLSATELSLVNKIWTACQVTVSGSGAVRIQLTPYQRLFLDEVKVVVDNTATGVEELSSRQQPVHVVYDLSGRKVTGPMGKGIFIVNGKKFVNR